MESTESYSFSFPVLIDKKYRYCFCREGEKMSEQTKMEKVKDFRPIDDVFFEVLAQNLEVC